MAGHATVGIDDDLSTCEPGVGVGTTQHELSRGIHKNPHRTRVEIGGQHRLDDVLYEVVPDGGVRVVAVDVLG